MYTVFIIETLKSVDFPWQRLFSSRVPSKQVGRRVVAGNNRDRPSTSRHPRAVSTQYTTVHGEQHIRQGTQQRFTLK